MAQSESIQKIAEALNKAQVEIRGANKNSENPHFRSQYANLKALWDAIRKPLTSNGLAVSQTTDVLDGKTVLITTLMHLSGEWIRGSYPLEPEKSNPQSRGAAMTYARRYCLAGIVGAYEDDDDAESAMADRPDPKVYHNETKPVATRRPEVAPPPQDRLLGLRRKMFAIGHEQGYGDIQIKQLVQKEYPHVKSRNDLNENQLNFLILWMQKNPIRDEQDDESDDVLPFEKLIKT